MGKKYIVELGMCERLYKALINGNGKPGLTWLSPKIDLTPYTELDLEQVRKEAYEKGYKKCMSENDFDSPCISCDKYEQGLNDAWEAARKVTYVSKYGGYGDCLDKVFNRHDGTKWDVFDYSASEAIEKIRQYEQEKEEIKVGDEVVGIFSDGSETRPFVFIRGSKEYYFGLYSDTGEFCQGGMNMRKTGRHFSEIAAVLEKMRGEKDVPETY